MVAKAARTATSFMAVGTVESQFAGAAQALNRDDASRAGCYMDGGVLRVVAVGRGVDDGRDFEEVSEDWKTNPVEDVAARWAAGAGLLRALKELYLRVPHGSVALQVDQEASSQDLGRAAVRRAADRESVLDADAADQLVLLGGFCFGRAHYL